MSFLWCAWLGSNLFFWGGILWLCSLEYLLWLFKLDLWEYCFLVLLLGGRSVLWCLIRFTWDTWGSLATCLICLVVDFEDSIFLACCLTLPVGNFSQIYIWIINVLETNSSSFRKNQKISQCKILAVSGGYLARDTWAWTALYTHQLTDCLVLKLVSRSNLALFLLVCSLQISSYSAQITSKLISSWVKHHDTYWSIPKSRIHAMTCLHLLDSGNMTSSQSNVFSHFSFHLRNLWYKLSTIFGKLDTLH